MSKFIVGLTGGIGSGKTTVANLFADCGITLIDADVIARQVVDLGSEGLAQISDHFGNNILLETGFLNRCKLREIIFTHPSEREWLDALLHPMIRAEIQHQVDLATSNYVIMVVPLLFENGLDARVNRTLVIDVTPELQKERTMLRDAVTETQIDNIIASQMSRGDKLSRAHDVINNQGNQSTLKEQVAKLHATYLMLASSVDHTS
ncbi:dephospho-CoA kinase [Shewanella surugensis]|uniref:Dephospho-CoA kinase n=1 Tax=Shewanella surugensis TaxID=212020 RepID=A0ABT0LDK7_9GAMM|nr:dephospho-CoA kinase [Shewanella surugensis]MCL1125774.1 dephospho-CoA kinase [Shewanella surugensis]